MVGTNFNFCVPCLVTSDGFLARLLIAFVGEDGGAPEDILRVDIMLPKCRYLLSNHWLNFIHYFNDHDRTHSRPSDLQ